MRRNLAVALLAVMSGSVTAACDSSERSAPTTTAAPSAAFDDTELAEIVSEIVTALPTATVADQLFAVFGPQDGQVNGGAPLLDLRAAVEPHLDAPITWATWEPGVGGLLLGQPVARGAMSIEVPYTKECGYDPSGPEPLCAEGGYVELAFEDGHWKHVRTVNTWIS